MEDIEQLLDALMGPDGAVRIAWVRVPPADDTRQELQNIHAATKGGIVMGSDLCSDWRTRRVLLAHPEFELCKRAQVVPTYTAVMTFNAAGIKRLRWEPFR